MPRKKKNNIIESADISEALDAYNNERLVSNHDKKQLAELSKKKKDPKDEFFDLIGYTEGSVKSISNLSSNNWPKVVKGSHLTVTTYENGKTELVWDDEALTRDVQKALTDYENSVKVNTVKTTKRKKKNEA